MESMIKERPSDNFKTAITDPPYFFGCQELLGKLISSPFKVRIILGGRRSGKTSLLRATEWNFLDPGTNRTIRAFPIFISLQVEQPKGLDNFRYLLIARLREAIGRWSKVPVSGLREMYRQFLGQIKSGEVTVSFLQQLNIKLDIANPDYERQLNHDDFRQALIATIKELHKMGFEGICFLLDEAEFIVNQSWSNDAWGYIRGIKDTDTALKPFLGFVLSGYRSLKDYHQRVGSPLVDIAEVSWLSPLNNIEISELISYRAKDEEIPLLPQKGVNFICEWAGCHPYLTQQMLNQIFDSYIKSNKFISTEILIEDLLEYHDHDFLRWWNFDRKTSELQEVQKLNDEERVTYLKLVQCRQSTDKNLAQMINLSRQKVSEALDVLLGTGVIRHIKDTRDYEVGARLFEEWITRQK